VSQLGYSQIELGLRILDLENELSNVKERFESEKNKIAQENARLKTKLSDSEKERKTLKALNPERLKKANTLQKKKTEAALTALNTLKHKFNQQLLMQRKLANQLQRSVLSVFEERDHFWQGHGFKLTHSKFRFPSETEMTTPIDRIRLTNCSTSESCVMVGVSEDRRIQILTEMDIPEEVEAVAIEAWLSMPSERFNQCVALTL